MNKTEELHIRIQMMEQLEKLIGKRNKKLSMQKKQLSEESSKEWWSQIHKIHYCQYDIMMMKLQLEDIKLKEKLILEGQGNFIVIAR